jgi:glutamate carboxypeptidase
MKIEYRETRGVSDGNILAECGLPCIDTLGAVGGKLHSSEEYLDLNSLSERAKLTALFLMKLGNSEYTLDHPNPPPYELS